MSRIFPPSKGPDDWKAFLADPKQSAVIEDRRQGAVNLTCVLIDFENVQPQDMSLLQGEQYRVTIFRGPHQNELDFDIAESLQPLGGNAKHVQSDRQGKNVLDFHMAFCLGRLVEEHAGDGSREKVEKRPGTRKSLARHIKCALGDEVTIEAALDLVSQLESDGIVRIKKDKIEEYKLPKRSG